jgi:hypothetical protein
MVICGRVMLSTIRSGPHPTGTITIQPGLIIGRMITISGVIITGAIMVGGGSIQSTARDITIRAGIIGIHIIHTGKGTTHLHPISAVPSLTAMH